MCGGTASRILEFCSGEKRTWALDVADDASGGIVHELDSDLSNTSTRTYNPSEQIRMHLSPAVAGL